MKDKWIGKFLSYQGAKKVIFKACHSGKLKLAYTSPNVISTSPPTVLMSRIDFTVLLTLIWIPQKNFTCPSGKLSSKFTSSIAKSTSPGYRTLLSLRTVYSLIIIIMYIQWFFIALYNNINGWYFYKIAYIKIKKDIHCKTLKSNNIINHC